MTNFTVKDLSGRFCDKPWNTASIETPGGGDDTLYMYTCWCGGWTKTPIGNLEEVSLKEAWKGSTATAIRETINQGTYYFCDGVDGCSDIHNLPGTPPQLPEIEELPTQIMIRIDRSCNLSCPTCRNEVYHEKAKADIYIEVLNKIIDAYKDFDKDVIVMLDGSGEFLASKAYRETLFSNKAPKCFKYQLMTNGTLLTKYRSTLESLGDSLDSFTITLDAATAETYAITRRGGNFNDLISGIELINEMGVIWFSSFVTQKANCHEMLDYYHLVKSLNAKQVLLSGTHYWEHMSKEYYDENKFETLIQIPKVQEQMNQLIEYKKTDEFLSFAGILNTYSPSTATQIIPTLNLDK